MLERIKNLVELSKFKPEEDKETGEPKLVKSEEAEGEPKGMATILGDDPLSIFPDEPHD